MRVRVFHFFLFCATAALVAFSLGIWVARGGALQKIGPSGEEQGVAHPRSVRVILPETLDGQSIPGHGTGLSDRGRDLSPIYPTSPQPHESKPASSMAAATTPSPRPQEPGGDVKPMQASAANEGGGSEAWEDDESHESPVDADSPPTSDLRLLRRLAPVSRHARGGYAHHQFYLTARRSRPGYGFGTFARLSASDHGR
jgi:hypothetical protein